MATLVSPTRSRAASARDFWRSHLLDRNTAVAVVASGLSIAFLYRMVNVVATTGSNNLSDDYVTYAPIVARMLSGHYDWLSYFRDTFYGHAHSFALPFLFRLAIARFDHWNIYDELYVSLAFASVKVVLLQRDFARGDRTPLAWVLWPFLALLTFSYSQINVFTYGDAGMPIEISQAGVALAALGIVAFPGRWRGISLVLAGGSVAALSGDGGLLIWPVALGGMYLAGFRRPAHYGLWFAGAVLSTLPYWLYMVFSGGPAAGTHPSLLNVGFIIATLGLPLSPILPPDLGIPVGCAALVLAASGCILLAWPGDRRQITAAIPALMCMAYSLATIWVISVFRPGVAPWYAGHSSLFWIGLVGLAYVFLAPLMRDVRARISPASCGWAAALGLTIAIAYLNSNLSYLGDVFFLDSRAPVSAACLHDYQSAPTYCEGYLFQWSPGYPQNISALGEPLAANRLSVFAPHQEWTLQGDYALPDVLLDERNHSLPAGWTPDNSYDLVPFFDYHHLNLALPPGDAIYWTVAVPAAASDAAFQSAMLTTASTSPTRLRATWTAYVLSGQRRHRAFDGTAVPDSQWRSLVIPLSHFKARVVTIELKVSGKSTGNAVLFRFPRIDVDLSGGLTGVAACFAPSPAERPGTRMVPAGDSLATSPGAQRVSGAGYLTFVSRHQTLPMYGEYLDVTATAGSDLSPGAIVVNVSAKDASGPVQAGPIILPFERDGRMHTYLYPLRLLQQAPATRIHSLNLRISDQAGVPEPGAVTINEVRVLKAKGPIPPPLCSGARGT